MHIKIGVIKVNKEIDARGLNCPLPVIHTKKALDSIEDGRITTIVDNDVAKENIAKLAKSMDFQVDIKQEEGNFYIDIFKNLPSGKTMDIEEFNKIPKEEENKDLVILISKDSLGEGSEELGKLLMKTYMFALTEAKPYPKTILLLNGGIYLALEDSEVLDHFKILESKGVEILSCGVCLDYFNVADKLAVGEISNMYTIVEKLNGANNTIKL